MSAGWQGRAFLAIANGVAPAMLADYETWHGVEHVPERLTMPGFLGAQRLVRDTRDGLDFLTLYELTDGGALETPAYRRLLREPTPASRRMRPFLTGFRRFAYRELARTGQGGAGHLGLLRLDRPDGPLDLGALAGRHGSISLRAGASLPTQPHPAFATEPEARAHRVVLASGEDADAVAESLAMIIARACAGPVLERSLFRLIGAY